MNIEPYRWGGVPCIRIIPDADELALLPLRDDHEIPLEALARLLAKQNYDSMWGCNAVNVLDEGIIYIPEYLGFTEPDRAETEKAYYGIMEHIVELLQHKGFLVTRKNRRHIASSSDRVIATALA